MINIFTSAWNLFKTHKYAKFMVFASIAIFMMLRQCNLTDIAQQEAEKYKIEVIRINNNLSAFKDTIKRYKVNETTWRSEKEGYTLKLDELEKEYIYLLGNFEYEKSKPPKTIIKTVYEIKDSIVKVPIYIADGDSIYDKKLKFSDSARFDNYNYRYLTGNIPFNYINDSTISPGLGTFSLKQGIKLNIGLFKDSESSKIRVKVDTDYPGIKFTELEGAYILDNPKNKKAVKGLQKQWGIGVSMGYGVMVPLTGAPGKLTTGPYIGVGLNYQPKFLQW